MIRGRLRGTDSGVTLVELVVTLAILAIVMVPLTGTVIGFFHNANATNDRLAENDDAQLAAAYFGQDVQSIGVRNWAAPPYAPQTSVEVNVNTANAPNQCGTGTAKIRMAWDEPTGTSGTQKVVVSYVVLSHDLHRLRCAGSTTPSTDLVIAHNVYSVDDPVLNPVGSTNPQTISMTLHIKAPTNGGAALDITLFGQRRQT